MNTKIKIIIGSVLAVAIGATAYFLINKDSNTKTTTTDTSKYSDIYDNIGTEVKMKSVQFDNIEDMISYTDDINTIKGVAEATEFIKIFFSDCQTNNVETMLTYYDESIWDYVMENEAFPFYDETGTVLFSPKNIEVKEGKAENVYIVKYSLDAILASTGEIIAEINREDTFELYKDFEVITIRNYIRNTTDYKYY